MNAYNPGRGVALPPRFWEMPGIPDWTNIRSVNDSNRTVTVKALGNIVTVSFEELDAAAQAVAR